MINSGTQEVEKFQNQVLRPVLKQQHHLLLAHFHTILQRRKISFDSLSTEDKDQLINTMLSKDNTFKNIQTGMIIGLLDLNEFKCYERHQKEYNRRILQMLKKRLKDALV